MNAWTDSAVLAWQVMDFIDARPERHYQGSWFIDYLLDDKTSCGTAACFAGWATLISGDERRRYAGDAVWSKDSGRRIFVRNRAAALLGLTSREADRLFDEDNTRADLRAMVTKIYGPRPADLPAIDLTTLCPAIAAELAGKQA